MTPPLRFDQLDPVRQATIRANLATMQAAGAPDSDVETYLTQGEHLAPIASGNASNGTGDSFDGHGASGTWGAPDHYNALNTFAHGASFGTSDKFNAAVHAAGAALSGQNFSDAYRQNLMVDRVGRAAFAQDHPIAAPALELSGGLLTGLLGGSALGLGADAQKVSAMARYAKGIGTGAAIGGASAVIENDGDPTTWSGLMDRLNAAKTGAELGAVGGAVAPPVIAGAVGAGKTIARAGAALGRGVASLGDELAPTATQVIRDAATALANKLPVNLRDPSSPTLTLSLAQPAESPLRVGGSLASTAGVDPTLSAQSSDATRFNPTGATQRLLRAVGRSDVTPQAALEAVRATPDNVPITAADLFGKSVQRLARNTAVIPSQGSTGISSMVGARNGAELRGVIDALEGSSGLTPGNLLDKAQQIIDRRQALAAPHYAIAFDESQTPPVPLTATAGDDGPTLADLLQRPSLQSAIKFHNDVAAERGETPLTLPSSTPAQEATPIPPFNPAFARDEKQWSDIVSLARSNGIALPGDQSPAQSEITSVPLKTLQQLKFKLDDALGFAKTNGTLPDGTAATKSKLAAINDTRRALLDIMTGHSEAYATGNQIYAGQSDLLNALEEGQNLFAMHPNDIAASLAGKNEGAQEMFRLGGMGAARDMLAKVATNASPADALARNDYIKNQLAYLFAEPADQQTFDNVLLRWRGIRGTDRFITGGSNTMDKAADALDNGPDWGNVALTAVTGGGVRGAAKTLVRSGLANQIAARAMGVNEATANSLGPLLTAGSGAPGAPSRQDLIQMLQELTQLHPRMMNQPSYRPGVNAGLAGTFSQLNGPQNR